MAYKRSEWTPSALMIPGSHVLERLPDGSARAKDGTVFPAYAACPPDTAWSNDNKACVSQPGARNIAFECGGLFAPWGSVPDCVDDGPPSLAVALAPPQKLIPGAPVSWSGSPYYQAYEWAGCDCEANTPTVAELNRAPYERSPAHADCGCGCGGSGACGGGRGLLESPFVMGILVAAAACALFGGGR